MPVVICLGFAVAGTLLFLTFIDFLLPFLEQWSIMMVGIVLLLILWYGLLVLIPRGVVWFMRFGDRAFFCLGRLVFGIRSGSMFQLQLFVLRTLLIGPKLLDSFSLACWWFGSWGWWYFLCGIAHSFVRGYIWKRLQGVQF